MKHTGDYLKNEVRIISGMWKGRKLPFPSNSAVRPTLSRARITLFNWLTGYIEGARCLDLFAGSGSLGLEAHSRGASETTLVDSDPRITDKLRSIVGAFKAEGVIVRTAHATNFLHTTQAVWDLVFLDPPYDSVLLPQILTQLPQHLSANALVYCETASPFKPPAGFIPLKYTRVGGNHLTLLILEIEEKEGIG